MSLFKFFKSKKESQSISELALDYDNLPVMTADELIKFTEQQNRIRRIKRIIKMDDERFKILYLDVIYRFAELVQLMPASQAHHHAVPGGLFIHTLEVIEYAMNIRQQYKLPAFAEQEVQERERHVWTYAIFVAALLHDVGKRVTMCDFMVDGKIYSAFEDRFLSETGYKNYKIVFNNPKYHHLHDQIGLTFSDLLPELGRKFIFSHLNIVKEMSAYIHNDKFNSGMIGEIISQADQRSTGESLAHTPTRKFKGATLENVGERLMTQLRLMIASNDFVINKPNANIYTSENGFTYCVSKVIVDAIREHLQKNNETDIPTDNNRIFDIFQEYGFAETNHYTGKSIHYIQIFHNGSSKVFTVLKFKTNKLFQVLPPEFDGKVEEIKDRESAKTPTIPEEHTAPTAMSEPSNNNKPKPEPNNDFPFPEPGSAEEASAEAINKPPIAQNTTVTTPDTAKKPPIPEPVNTDDDFPIAAKSINETEPVIAEQPVVDKKSQADLEKQQLATDFMDWCRKKIADKSIVINESNGPIQKVAYSSDGVSAIAMVTPRIFAEYADSIGMPNSTDKATYTKIQSAIHQQKLNIPAARGQIHTYKIKKSINNGLNRNIKLRHYLFSIDDFCGNDEKVREIVSKIKNNTNLVKV